MAAAIAKHYFSHRLTIDSAGVTVGEVNAFAVAVMEEIGIDLSLHGPKSFEDIGDDRFDLVISLTPEAQHRAVELTRTMDCTLEYWPTIDPAARVGNRGVILDGYRELRRMLLGRIMSRFRHAPMSADSA